MGFVDSKSTSARQATRKKYFGLVMLNECEGLQRRAVIGRSQG